MVPECTRDALGERSDLGARPHERAQHRHLADEALRVRVHRKESAESGERQLVDPHRALDGVASHGGDEIGPTRDDAGLRAAQQLVAAEGDEIRTRGERFARGRLVGETEALELHERAAPEVVDPREPVFARERRKPGRLGRGREPLHLVVAGVHGHDRTGAPTHRALEVREVGTVRGPHLHEPAASPSHELGDPERPPDLDELSTRHRNLAAEREGVEDEEHGRRVVVDHGRRLGSREPRDPALDVVVSFPAPPGREVELEIDGPARRLRHRRDRDFGKRGAAEVGVEDRAREIQDRAERCAHRGAHAFERGFRELALRIGRQLRAFVERRRAKRGDGRAHRFDRKLAPVLSGARIDFGPPQDPIDGGKAPRGVPDSPSHARPVRP